MAVIENRLDRLPRTGVQFGNASGKDGSYFPFSREMTVWRDHIQLFGEMRLTPAAYPAQFLQAVLHAYRRVRIADTTA